MDEKNGGETTHALFGDPAEWENFERRNPEFVKRIGNLVNTIKLAFSSLLLREPLDKILFLLDRLCAEDFSEILLLCGNGYGIGAEKLLRGMYERAVTATYLSQHPEEAADVLDYHKIQAHKLMNAMVAILGDPFSEDQKKTIEREFEEVKPKFMITHCKKCKRKRLNHTWTKIDFATMAKKSGVLAELLVPAYYMGVREGHGTIEAVFSRLDAGAAQAGEGLVFDGGSQPKRADTALLTAHKIILMVLDLHKNYFQLEHLHGPLQDCVQDLFGNLG